RHPIGVFDIFLSFSMLAERSIVVTLALSERMAVRMQQGSESSPPSVRVAVVDDYQMIVDSLIAHLSTNDSDIEVVISATSWDELTSHPEYPTDVTVLDLNLGDQIRIETKMTALTASGSAVILISRHTSAVAIARALGSGALGFVPKSAPA